MRKVLGDQTGTDGSPRTDRDAERVQRFVDRVAASERLHIRFGFKRYFETGAIDVALASYCPIGPVALAASIQVTAIAPSALVQEQTLYHVGNREQYVTDPCPLYHDDGFVDPLTEPGLGVEVDADAVRELGSEGLNYSRPIYEYADSGVSDG